MENTTTSLIDTIKKEFENFEQRKKVLTKELRKQFPELLAPLFAKYPRIKSISWTQYTPYWNDGDTCEFRRNSELEINGHEEYDDEPLFLKPFINETITNENIEEHKQFNITKYGYKWAADYKVGQNGYFPNPEFDEYTYEGVREFKSVLNNIPKDFYEDLFGDHTRVTITADGNIQINECEHD